MGFAVIGDSYKQTAINILLMLAIAGAWVGSMQLISCTYSPSYDGVLLYVWFSTAWLISFYPIARFFSRFQKKEYIIEYERTCDSVHALNSLCLKTFVTKICPLCLLWFLSNYLFLQSLTGLTATDTSAIFSTCSVFIYIFSVFVFQESVLTLRVISVLLSLFGFALLCSIDGIFRPGFVAIILSVGSAVSASVYKVLHHYILGSATFADISMFLSMLGLCDLLLLWPIVLFASCMRYETYTWEMIPWDILTMAALFGWVLNILVTFGRAVTSPVNITLGTLLGIPTNAVVDMLAYEVSFSWLKITALLFICAGFILMLTPTSRNQKEAISLASKAETPPFRNISGGEGEEFGKIFRFSDALPKHPQKISGPP